MNDDIVEAITKIANAKLQKKHPDINIKEWQTREILEAMELFQNEWERLQKTT